MKKFLTVLLVIAVMFTFSFGSAMAVTYDASQVASAYTDEMNTQLGYLATAKARAIALYTYDTDGYTTGEAGEPVGLTKEALGVAADYIIDLAEKAMTKVVNAAAEQTYSDDTASINTDDVKYALVIDVNGNGSYDGSDDYDVDDLNSAWNLYDTIMDVTEALAAAYEAQEPVSRAFFTGKINGVDLSKYSDTDKEYAESIGAGSFLEGTAAVQTGTALTPAGYVDYLESVAVAEIAAEAATTHTDAVKVEAYKTIADKFAALVKTIATTADEEYNDTTEKTVEQAVDAYLAYGKGALYDDCKLVDTNNDGKYIEKVDALKALTGAIYEPKTPYSKATLFGVEVADITKITKAEATAINNAFYKAIVDSAEVVRAYAGTDASKVDPLYTAETPAVEAQYTELIGTINDPHLFASFLEAAGKLFVKNANDEYVEVTWAEYYAHKNAGGDSKVYKVTPAVPAGIVGNATKFLATLDKAVEAVDVYGKVVDLGTAYKAETIVGVKTYDDANVDKAVAEAKKLVYKDLVAGFKTPAAYIKAAADKLDINIYAVNYEYDKFQKAMDDANAKMWESASKPARKVTYGEDKTADEDLVYLLGTYASSEREDWEEIANDATKAIYNAESYADIEAALKAAAEDFGKLLTAKDEVAVVTARAKYVNALNDFVEGQKKIMGTVNYSSQAFADAKEDGVDLINDANTVADVEAAYKEAQGLVTGIKTKNELKAMKDALVAQIAALPKASALTAADKAAVVAAFDAYKEYVETPGATDVIVNKNLLKDALETVYTLEGKDLRAKVDAVEKELKKLAPNGYAVSDDAAVELASKRAEYKALYDSVDAFNEEVANDDETGVNDYFADLVDQINIDKIETALYSEKAVWDGELMNVGVLAVKATKAGATVAQQKEALNAYNALTDRQKYAMDSNVLELIKRVEANIVDEVKALKITASSKATKGAITVTWTVKGDAAAADGFQVWKSTKMNKGYKKAFTTTKTTYKNTKGLKKGVKYYYKVRAYKVVDGVNVYSDWSNKAYRTAK